MNKKKIECLKTEYLERQEKIKNRAIENRKYILKFKQLNIYQTNEETQDLDEELYAVIEDMIFVINEKETIAKSLLEKIQSPDFAKKMGIFKYKMLQELKEMSNMVDYICDSMLSCFNSIFEAGWLSDQMLSDFETLEYFLNQHCLTFFQIFDLVLKEIDKDLANKHGLFGFGKQE
jgi:hypothetical protein